MKELSSFPGIPWFLPEWLGGVGIPLDHDDEVSEVDRRCATIIKNQMNVNRNLHPVKPKDAAMWLMHKHVMVDLRPYSYLGEPLYRNGIDKDGKIFRLEDEYAKLYKMMTINLLEKQPLESLYEILDEDHNVKKAMWQNSRVFSTARHMLSIKGKALPVPMSNEDMLYENKDLVIPCLVKDFIENPKFACLANEYDRPYPGLGLNGRGTYGLVEEAL